ncbi:phage head closure protein [Phocaeicola sp.]
MQAGLLREKITFYRNETIRDNFGGNSQSWVKAFDKRARVTFKNGQRKEIAGEIVNSTSNTFMIRYCKDITANMRIYYDGRKYKIESINKDRIQQATIIEAELINE